MKKKHETEPEMTFHCRACGSRNLVRDAELKWSRKKQKWKIKGLLDSFYCVDCEWSGEYCDIKTYPKEGVADVSPVQTVLPPLPEPRDT